MAQDNFSLLNANLDDSLRPLFANKIFLASIALFFALYAGWLAPKLPNSVIYFFDTIPGKLLFIFIIAFVASRRVENSFQVALVVSVMFLVTLTVLNKVKMQEAFQNLSMEHFNLMGTMQNIMQGQHQEDYSGDPKPADNSGASSSGPKEGQGAAQGAAQGGAAQGAAQEAAQGAESETPGDKGKSCKPDGTCNSNLECKDNKCHESSAPPAPNKQEPFEAFSNYNNYSDY